MGAPNKHSDFCIIFILAPVAVDVQGDSNRCASAHSFITKDVQSLSDVVTTSGRGQNGRNIR